MKIRLTVAYVAAFLFANSSFAETSESPFRVGVIYGFSGAASAWSDFGKKGLELAQEEINASGGIRGRKLELVLEDSRTNPSGTVTGFRKLTSVDHVDAVIGDVWSFLTNPLVPLTAREHVPVISPTVMDGAVQGSSPYFFTMGHRVESIEPSVDEFFHINQEVKSVGIICWDDAWGETHRQLWRRAAERAGAKVVAELCSNDFNNDYRSEVTRLAALKPDAIIIAMYAERVAARMREQHLRAKLLSTSDAAEGVQIRKADTKLLEGAFFTYWVPEKSFIDRFSKQFGVEPMLEAENHYEALRAIAKAATMDPSNIIHGLAELKYRGVGGEIDFHQTSFPNLGRGTLMRIQNGAIQKVFPTLETAPLHK